MSVSRPRAVTMELAVEMCVREDIKEDSDNKCYQFARAREAGWKELSGRDWPSIALFGHVRI